MRRLAIALSAQATATPGARTTDNAKARDYFEGQAVRQLLKPADPVERLTLAETKKARAAATATHEFAVWSAT